MMACRITELVIDARDPQLLAAFWCTALDYIILGVEDDDIEIGPLDTGFGGPRPTLVFNRSTDPRGAKLALHLDVSPTDQDQQAELARLLEIGAQSVDIGQTGDESWHVLADPEGNEFCLLRAQVHPV